MEITQLNIVMPIPPGLTSASYSLVKPSVGALQDSSGTSHAPLNEIDLTTDEWNSATCVRGGGTATGSDFPEMVVTVWDIDPADLGGMGYGTDADSTHVGSVWLHIESEDGGPGCSSGNMSSVLETQTPLLTQMIHAAKST